MVLIFILLMSNSDKHIFTCLLAITISFFMYLFQNFSVFKLDFFILLLSCKNSLYVLDASPYQTYALQIFSPRLLYQLQRAEC